METLNAERKKDGMKLNKKTKIMCNDTARTKQGKGIEIDGEQLKEAEEYECLKRLLTPDSEMSKEIDQRITAGKDLESTASF